MPPRFGDARAVLAMLVARDLVDYGVPDMTLAELEDEWSAESFDLDADALVAQTQAGAIAGYAIIHRPGAMGFVSVDHEGQGIGTRLVQWGRKRERELGRAHHRQAIPAGNARARELLLASGYEYERSFSRMVRALDGQRARAGAGRRVGPAGVRARTDSRAVHALDELSFAANADFQAETLEEFTDEHLRPREFAPELSLVVHDADTMVGFLLARRWSEAGGWIHRSPRRASAVAPAWGRLGAAAHRVRALRRRRAARGPARRRLGQSAGAALYERAGMRPRFAVDAYVRELDDSAGRA